MSMRFRYVGLGLVLSAGAAAAFGCSSGASAPPGGSGTGGETFGTGATTGGGSGGGGATGTGGTSSSSGGTSSTTGGTSNATGGASGSGGSSITTSTDCQNSSDLTGFKGSVTTCSNTPDPSTIPKACASACTMQGCSNAHCVSQSLLPSTISSATTDLLAKCPDGSFCVPDDFIYTQGVFTVKKCTSLLQAEGRCISTCIPQVNTQLTTLPKDVCADGELCAPCWNPIDGTDTHACTQGCGDAPASSTPPASAVFQKCGSDLGVCVPQKLVSDPVQLTALKSIDDPTACSVKCPSGTPPACTGSDTDGPYVCAPVLKAKDQSANFAPCTMTSAAALLATMKNSTGQLAACVPKYIVPTSQQGLLLQDGCQTGELCAPCYNPLSTPTANAPTGACPP